MNILVTFAAPEEFGPWRRRRAFTTVKVADFEIYRTRIPNAEVSVFLTGIGPTKSGARMRGLSMERAIEKRCFDVCISTGLAGSLRAQYRPCHVLAARSVRANQGDQDFGRGRLASDRMLLDIAEISGARIVEAFFTSDHIVSSPREKAKLGNFADAVDMESFGILNEASVWGTRAIAIRAISDGFDQELPLDFNAALTKDGKVSVTRVIGQLAAKPWRAPSLLAFAHQSRRAAKALADFLDRYVGALSQSNRQPLRVEEEVSAT